MCRSVTYHFVCACGSLPWHTTKDADAACRAVLVTIASGGCVFEDIFHLLRETQMQGDVFASLAGLSYAQKVSALASMSVAPWAWCAAHSRHCPLERVHINVSGTPCQDWSVSGRRLRHQGPQMSIFLAWCRIVVQQCVPVVVHENVPGFDAELLYTHLGHDYHIFTGIIDTVSVGFALISSTRRWSIMYHKRHSVVVRNPDDLFTHIADALQAGGNACVPDCALATFEELVGSVRSMCRTRGVALDEVFDFERRRVKNMRAVLTADERRRLSEYEQAWRKRHRTSPRVSMTAVFVLGDNPSCRLTWSLCGVDTCIARRHVNAHPHIMSHRLG